METHSWMMVLVISALLGCSAFFSASETAFSTFNKLRMKKKAEDGDRRAQAVLRLSEQYDKILATVLIGNNIVNITASALATLFFSALLGPGRGALTATVCMTVLVLAFGEILPKSYGKEHSDRVILGSSAWLTGISVLLTPLSFLFTRLNGLRRRGASGDSSPGITEEELIYMIDSIDEDVLEEQERDLVQSALEFDEISIREILTPRVNVAALDVDSPLEEIKRIVLEEGYSRIPVYENTVDNIIGVLYSRDFLRALVTGEEVRLREMLGEPLFVHKGMKVSNLLASFKSRKLNLAVVVDEYGGTLGIVTMEDVLEELVGDIWDEDDEIPRAFTLTDEGQWEAAGDYDLADILERLEIDEDKVENDFATVGGWALHMLEHIPEIGEAFSFEGYRFTVLEMDGHRLRKLGVRREEPSLELEKDEKKG